MFGLGLLKHKKKLTEGFSSCFSPLKDELGNVPVEMQFDAFTNGAVLQVCEIYLKEHIIQKNTSKASILDAVFEEIYRRESLNVQERVQAWNETSDEHFKQGQEQANSHGDSSGQLKWLSKYSQEHFKRANNLML